MNCLKCGKETEHGQVFCADCQSSMQKYPVDPGTVVHLPHRDPAWDKKPVYEREQTEAEIIAKLRRLIRWLTLTVGILTLLVCLLAGLLFTAWENNPGDLDIGKNYSTVGTDEST